MNQIHDELLRTLHSWGLSYGWQKTAYSIYQESFAGRFPTLVKMRDEDPKRDRFLRQVFGQDADLSVHQADAFLRIFMQDAVPLAGRYAYLEQRQKARIDAGMGSGKPFAEIHYDVTASAVGIDVKLELFYGNRTLLSCEYYDWRKQGFADLYMARYCDHQYVDNGSRMCLSRSKCIKCGHTIEVDSSD